MMRMGGFVFVLFIVFILGNLVAEAIKRGLAW